MKLLLLLVITYCGIFGQSNAAPKFSNLFTENAVLQRGENIPVTGFDADPTQLLSVRLGSLEVKAVVQPNGNWLARFDKLAATEKMSSMELVVDGEVVKSVSGVIIGDVWLAAGQSNMQMQVGGMLKQMPPAQAWIDSADLSTVRFRRVNDKVLPDRNTEASDIVAEPWSIMTPENVLRFSAAAAVYAREIAEKTGVPIGIIDVSWGGKPIESFIPRETYSSAALLQSIKQLADMEKLEQLQNLRGGVIIRNPEGYPGSIFNARIAPLAECGLAGFLWYQAESNAGRGEDPREYRLKMKALADGWRVRWQQASLPFYFVQLPSFPQATGWIRVREEQRRALELIPKSAMAVTIDIRGEGIHPPDKLELGKRLARCALKQTYQQEGIVASGPSYQSHSLDADTITVHFTNCEVGLAVGNRPVFAEVEFSEKRNISWFEVAGQDGEWHPASASISGESAVTVVSDKEPNPVAVRYACHTDPQGDNLYNQLGLPASPFCSNLEMLGWVDQQPLKKK